MLRRRGRHQEPEGDGNGAKGAGQEVSPLLDSTTQASEEVKRLLEAAGDASAKIREAARTDASPGETRLEGNEPAALISKINSEVRTVLEAADEAAEKIREEAHAESRRVVEENRRRAESVTAEHLKKVTDMTEQVMGQLAAVESHLDTLRKAFDQSIKTLGADLRIESSGSEVWATKRNGAEDEEDADDLRSRLGRRAKPKAAEPEGISEGARLLALQQLMAGVDAEVIAQRLTKEFGIKDPQPILDWIGAQPAPRQRVRKK